MQLISERGINLHFFPMVNARGRTYNSETIKYKNNAPFFIAHKDSRWTYSCYKLMDFIASKFRERFIAKYEETNKQQYPVTNVGLHPHIRQMLPLLYNRSIFNCLEDGDENYCSSIYNNIVFKFSVTDLINSKIFKSINVPELDIVLKTISTCKIKTNYKIKTEKSTRDKFGNNKFGFHKGYDNLQKQFQTLFSYEKLTGKSTQYRIKFDTIFGACFVHNVLTGGYQTIEEPFYSLSQSANIFFRHRFFMFSKLPKCYINIDYFNNVLGFSTPNSTVSRKRFLSVIEELESNSLIKIIRQNSKFKFEVSRNRTNRKVIDIKSKAN